VVLHLNEIRISDDTSSRRSPKGTLGVPMQKSAPVKFGFCRVRDPHPAHRVLVPEGDTPERNASDGRRSGGGVRLRGGELASAN